MVWVDGKFKATCHPPREVAGKPVGDLLPAGDGSDVLRQIMESSHIILREHPLNAERREAGLKPANCLWLWGQGKSPNLTKLTEARGLTGSVITASDLARGVGLAAGLDAADPADFVVGGVVDLAAQRDIALREARRHDILYVHAALPDDLTDRRDAKERVKTVEEFDRLLVGPLMDGLAALGPHRVLVQCDFGHGAEIAEGVVPYVLYEGPVKGAGERRRFTEAAALSAQPKPRDAARLAARLLPKV
jgi:2,3-bisphosphoglycerate-independent phosphoglycerate mutase